MKKIKLMITFLVIMGAFAGCATKQNMEGSNVVPGAAGMVTTKEADNNNTSMTVTVKHLAPAQKIYTGATNYIVWVQPEGTDTYQNVGALQVDSDLEGKHTTTIPYRSFKVLVTPEMSSMTQSPTGPAVFEQRVMRQ
ncbi:MAG: hypothetical protein H7281_16635 [Bacteriovorax sp.]|nr:hypothetical protein [Bacteriovorax sp.]